MLPPIFAYLPFYHRGLPSLRIDAFDFAIRCHVASHYEAAYYAHFSDIFHLVAMAEKRQADISCIPIISAMSRRIYYASPEAERRLHCGTAAAYYAGRYIQLHIQVSLVEAGRFAMLQVSRFDY